MASVLSNEDIKYWRKIALAAEPYEEDGEEMNTFDGEWTPGQQMRRQATIARAVLKRAGIPLKDE